MKPYIERYIQDATSDRSEQAPPCYGNSCISEVSLTKKKMQIRRTAWFCMGEPIPALEAAEVKIL